MEELLQQRAELKKQMEALDRLIRAEQKKEEEALFEKARDTVKRVRECSPHNKDAKQLETIMENWEGFHDHMEYHLLMIYDDHLADGPYECEKGVQCMMKKIVRYAATYKEGNKMCFQKWLLEMITDTMRGVMSKASSETYNVDVHEDVCSFFVR